MNETTCQDCGKPIYWVENVGRWYHFYLGDILNCPASAVEPADQPAEV